MIKQFIESSRFQEALRITEIKSELDLDLKAKIEQIQSFNKKEKKVELKNN